MKQVYIYIAVGNVVALVLQFILFELLARKHRPMKGIPVSILISAVCYLAIYVVLQKYFFVIEPSDFLYYFVGPSYSLFFLFSMRMFKTGDTNLSGKVQTQTKNESFVRKPDPVVFNTDNGEITINNPFTHFLVLAGTRSGKTKSIGLNLLKYYLTNHFCGFIYDAKMFDYTRHAYYFKVLEKIGVPIYHLGFSDHGKTYRTNMIKPKVVGNYTFLAEIIRDISVGLMENDAKKDEWFTSGLGIIQGVAVRMFMDFPQLCTLGHVSLFVSTKNEKELEAFIKGRTESQVYADEFIKSKGSERTRGSILSSAAQLLKPLAANKDVLYVLTGDDFDFDLVGHGGPKIIAVSNDRRNASVLNGLIGSMVNILSKKIEFGNTQRVFFFFDEGTTFRVPDFSEMVSVLAEYMVSFAFLTQSKSKMEEIYKPTVTKSLVANFNNKFLGRTNEPMDARDYSSIFGSQEVQRVTKSSGSSSNERQSTYSRGTSISSSDKTVFKSDDFMALGQGQFICNFLDANYHSGKFYFDQAAIDDERLNDVLLEVNPSFGDVAHANYQKIMHDIEKL
ncbi:MAG: type IV secretory system conjugative DNA transfer family protein [Bacteroidota bacterium]